MGARHRDHQTTGSTFKGINSGLITYFFGADKEGILTVDKFLDFQRHLQNEILALEFKRKIGSQEGKLSEKDFAELLIAYAGFSSKKRTKMIRRVRKEFHHPHHHDHHHEHSHESHNGRTRDDANDDNVGISLSDYLKFYQVGCFMTFLPRITVRMMSDPMGTKHSNVWRFVLTLLSLLMVLVYICWLRCACSRILSLDEGQRNAEALDTRVKLILKWSPKSRLFSHNYSLLKFWVCLSSAIIILCLNNNQKSCWLINDHGQRF